MLELLVPVALIAYAFLMLSLSWRIIWIGVETLDETRE
jgi:hypothetical protein